MKLKKVLAIALSAALLTSSLSACSSNESTANTETVTVKLGVVGSVYEELWAPAIESLKKEGINLEIVEFSDYVTPNNALANGEIDLNGFQHRIYLQSEIDAYGYEIEAVGNTFIVPLNLYSDKIDTVDELKDGDTIAIPDDVTNGGRALKNLEAAGIITLSEDAGFNPTVEDIASYNVAVEIEELKANVIPSTLADVTAGVVNASYAVDFGLDMQTPVYQDSVLDIEEYWNIVAARSADLEDPEKVELYSKIIEAFQTEATEKIFTETYHGSFVKVGWEQDLLEDNK